MAECLFPSRNLYVAIEGIIACGKSALLRRLSFDRDLHCVSEPVHLFQSFGRHNPLALQYTDPSRSLVVAQHHIMRMSAAHYRAEVPDDDALLEGKVILSERSILSPIAFINANYERGQFSDFAREYLLEELQSLSVGVRRPDAVIFISASPDLCQSRIHLRNREGEEACDMQLQESLARSYEAVLAAAGVPVHVISPHCESTYDDLCLQVRRILRNMLAERARVSGKDNNNNNEDGAIFGASGDGEWG